VALGAGGTQITGSSEGIVVCIGGPGAANGETGDPVGWIGGPVALGAGGTQITESPNGLVVCIGNTKEANGETEPPGGGADNEVGGSEMVDAAALGSTGLAKQSVISSSTEDASETDSLLEGPVSRKRTRLGDGNGKHDGLGCVYRGAFSRECIVFR
jgi:hypothetical protein